MLHYHFLLPLDIKNRKPWLTSALKPYISFKNKLNVHTYVLASPSIALESSYKAYRNKLNIILRKAEKDNYQERFMTCTNYLRTPWQLIKEVI